MPVRLGKLKKALEMRKNTGSLIARVSHKKKDKDLTRFYAVFISGKQVGELQKDIESCYDYIEENKLENKLPVIETFIAKAFLRCEPTCLGRLYPSVYKIDKILYKCPLGHEVAV